MEGSWWSYTTFLFDIPKLFLFFHGWPHGLLDCLLSRLGRVYYRLTILFQVLLAQSRLRCRRCAKRRDIRLVRGAKADSSSPELVREATSSSVSLAEIPTTLLEDALAFLFDFLFVTVIHCWLSIMSGWTHIVSPWGVGTEIRLFSFWFWGSVLTTLSSPFGMGTTLVGVGRRSQSNWIGDVVVMLVVTFFYYRWSLSTSASIRAWRTSLKM